MKYKEDVFLISGETGEELACFEKGTNIQVWSNKMVYSTLKEIVEYRNAEKTITKEMRNFMGELYNKRSNTDEFGKVKLEGRFISERYFKVGREYDLGKEFMIMPQVLSHSNYIKRSVNDKENKLCHTWKEIYEALEISGRTKQMKFKEACIKEGIIHFKQHPKFKKEVASVHPLFLRNGSYVPFEIIILYAKDIFKYLNNFNRVFLYVNSEVLTYEEFMELGGLNEEE